MINWTLLRPSNLIRIMAISLAAMFVMSGAKQALDNGSSDDS